jgi:hypothetical protein
MAYTNNFGRDDCNGPRTDNPPTSTTLTLSKPGCTDGIRNQGEIWIDCGGPCKKCPMPYVKVSMESRYSVDRGETLAMGITLNANQTGKYVLQLMPPEPFRGNGGTVIVASATAGEERVMNFNTVAAADANDGDYTFAVSVMDGRNLTVASAQRTVTIESPIVLDTPVMKVRFPTVTEAKRTVEEAQGRVFSLISHTSTTVYSNTMFWPVLVLVLICAGYFYVTRTRRLV